MSGVERIQVILKHLQPKESILVAEQNSTSSVGNFEEDFKKLRKTFLSGKTRKYGWRRDQLTKLLNVLKENKEKLVEAGLLLLFLLLFLTKIFSNERFWKETSFGEYSYLESCN